LTVICYLVFRAVENRVSLIRADIGFDSAIIDPTSRILGLALSSVPRAALVQASVPMGRADAPLIKIGDWLGWVCMAGTGFFIVQSLASARTRRPPRVAAEDLPAAV
jgi:apolipoprotein N-acyltransferase